jgi:hypothetical protein
MLQFSESDYRIAQKSRIPVVRQNFLNSLNFGEARQFVRGISYIPKDPPTIEGSSTTLDQDTLMGCNGPVFPLYSQINFHRMRINGLLSSELNVYPRAFNFSADSFANMLDSHELYHARQHYERAEETRDLEKLEMALPVGSQARKKLSAIIEIPAYINELLMAKSRKIPEEEIRSLHYVLREMVDDFRDLEKMQIPRVRHLLERLSPGVPPEELNEWINPYNDTSF